MSTHVLTILAVLKVAKDVYGAANTAIDIGKGVYSLYTWVTTTTTTTTTTEEEDIPDDYELLDGD